MVEQSQAADLLFSQETIASVVALCPSIPEPFHALIEPFRGALDSVIAPYDFGPLLEHLNGILQETEDDPMLGEVLDAFTFFFRPNVTPPLSIQPDLYYTFKELLTGDFAKEVRLKTTPFQAGLLRCLGLEFIANPPVDDPEAGSLTLGIAFANYRDLTKDMAKAFAFLPVVTNYVYYYTSVLQATIQFYVAHPNGPYSSKHVADMRNVVRDRVAKLSAFLKAESGTLPTEELTSNNMHSFQMSLVVLEVLECLVPWIANGKAHHQNEKFSTRYHCMPTSINVRSQII